MTVIGRNRTETALEQNDDCGNVMAMALDTSFVVMADGDATAMMLDTNFASMADNDVTTITLDANLERWHAKGKSEFIMVGR